MYFEKYNVFQKLLKENNYKELSSLLCKYKQVTFVTKSETEVKSQLNNINTILFSNSLQTNETTSKIEIVNFDNLKSNTQFLKFMKNIIKTNIVYNSKYLFNEYIEKLDSKYNNSYKINNLVYECTDVNNKYTFNIFNILKNIETIKQLILLQERDELRRNELNDLCLMYFNETLNDNIIEQKLDLNNKTSQSYFRNSHELMLRTEIRKNSEIINELRKKSLYEQINFQFEKLTNITNIFSILIP
jgi:hypothetical protein